MTFRKSTGDEVSELIEGFYRARVSYREQMDDYRKDGGFYFLRMDELEKHLYRLKNDAHRIFGGSGDLQEQHFGREHLFDLIIGSIFHEALHLKEYIYTLEQYKTRYESMAHRYKFRKTSEPQDEFIEYTERIVTEAESELPVKAENINTLFKDAVAVSQSILKKFRRNRRLNRVLYIEADLIDKVHGQGGLKKVYDLMYSLGAMEGYYQAGMSFMHGGFFEEAEEAFNKALSRSVNSKDGDKLVEEIKARKAQIKKRSEE